MFEILTGVLGYVIIGGVVAILVIKEVAAYRLPVSHPLNAWLTRLVRMHQMTRAALAAALPMVIFAEAIGGPVSWVRLTRGLRMIET